MDTNIECLVKTISDSIKKKDEEIANLKTDLEICENRIKELEEKKKKLQEKNKKYAEQIAKNAVE